MRTVPQIGTHPARAAARLAGRLVGAAALSLLLAGCAAETLFRSDFDVTPAGQPPATAQPVGTAHPFGPAGSVVVVPPPVTPSGKWVRIRRPDGPDVAGLQGRFAATAGDGTYTFSATMFMPTGAGVATVQFEAFDAQPSTPSGFLHLDFLQDGTVRVDDDDAATFGAFPRDQPFIVQVTLRIGAPASTARIVLAGADASGEREHTVRAAFQARSRQFGAIRIWQGFPHTGAFDATNIAVTRRGS